MSSPRLPQEILDYIIDILRDEPRTLQDCSLVARSWVPRVRKHLFASVRFGSLGDLQLWKKAFPDPSNSPVCYTRDLSIRFTRAMITAADATDSDWVIPTFSRVVSLRLDIRVASLKEMSLAPLHRLSPVLKSLYVDAVNIPCTQFFDLVFSFPLLEDLFLLCYDLSLGNHEDIRVPQDLVPLQSPAFTGSLTLLAIISVGIAERRLLDLPGGLRFKALTLTWCGEGDLQLLKRLVGACSGTLESLTVMRLPPDTFTPASIIGLSEAPKLRDATFRTGSLSVGWVAMTLETITSKNQDLKQVSIRVSDTEVIDVGVNFGEAAVEQSLGQWLDLDHSLVRVWESHSIRSRVVWKTGKRNVEEFTRRLLPEVTKRGILDVVE